MQDLPCARIACARRTAYRRANRRRFIRRGAQAGGFSRHPAHKKRDSSSCGATFLDCDYRSLRCPKQRFCETPRISDRRAQHRGKTRSLCAAGTSLAAPVETNIGNPVSYFSQGAWCAPLSVKLSQIGSFSRPRRQQRWEPYEEAELKELRRISEALN
jgi:hypothetical protein